jgi:hypothetical protein
MEGSAFQQGLLNCFNSPYSGGTARKPDSA